MQIDLRQPALVLAGYWNPHIFSLDWMAMNLFRLESGVTVEVGQAITSDRPFPIFFLEGVGVSCTLERLELFATDTSDEAMAKVEKIADRALELLSHTPVFAIGANFKFSDEVVEAAFSDALKTPENLEAQFGVVSQEFKSELKLDEHIILNLTRQISEDGTEVALNFHHATTGVTAIRKALDGYLVKNRARAYEVMENLYGANDFLMTRFDSQPMENLDG